MKYGRFFCLVLLAGAIFLPARAQAVQPDEILADPVLESRAREISQNLRCLVCSNQSIDESDADLARDLRLIVRERLLAGDEDRQVLDYIVERYGSYILLKPPVNMQTTLLWLGPLLITGLAVLIVCFWFRNRNRDAILAPPGQETPPLSHAEKKRLAALLKED